MQTRNQINRRDKQAREHGPKYLPTKSETKQKEEKDNVIPKYQRKKYTPISCNTTKDTLPKHTSPPHCSGLHRAFATLHQAIPLFIQRIQQAITPGMTDTPATSTEAEEQNETTPRLTSPSPPAGPEDTTPAIDDSSVDLSAVVSDTTQDISQLRRALDLVEDQDNIAFTENPGNTYPSPANETKEPRPSNKKLHSQHKKKKNNRARRVSKDSRRRSKNRMHHSPDGGDDPSSSSSDSSSSNSSDEPIWLIKQQPRLRPKHNNAW
jgi:hypothetical protein